MYSGPPPTYETARLLIADAFEQNGLNYSNQLSTYTQRFLSKFGVVSAQKSCKHDSVMKQFCVKLEKAPPFKILNLSSLGKKSANDDRCEALYQMLLKKFEEAGLHKKRIRVGFRKKTIWKSFCKGIKHHLLSQKCKKHPITFKLVQKFQKRLMDQFHKNVVHDVYHQWLKWCRSHHVWDDSIKTHVGAVIRKFKNTPKSISKSNEIIIASINIRSVKDHLPAMILDNSDPVVWCMQEISTPSPPTLPRGWKIFLNPRTGGDRHAGGTGFAVDTIESKQLHATIRENMLLVAKTQSGSGFASISTLHFFLLPFTVLHWIVILTTRSGKR